MSPDAAEEGRKPRPMRSLAVLASALILVGAVSMLWHSLLAALSVPKSTPIMLENPPGPPAAEPAALVAAAGHAGPDRVARLGFVGDIMQHHRQAGDDFHASYEAVAPLIAGFDLALGNLEFPVDPEAPIGPPVGSVRFNGAPAHLDALAAAGFDALSIANNHSYDQGPDGLEATRRALIARGLTPVGAAPPGVAVTPSVLEMSGLRLAMQAYTFAPNGYPVPDDPAVTDWPPRDLPLVELHFADWQGAFRAEGLARFAADIAAADRVGADFRIAMVHWGVEWRLRPTADQRRAAHDMIDAGFDLVVGGHAHVLNPPEVYRGRLIAYSLGNFISDFVPLETRTGAVLEVVLARDADGAARAVDFCFHPVLTVREGHRVRPVGVEGGGDEATALGHAIDILGANAVGRGGACPSPGPSN